MDTALPPFVGMGWAMEHRDRVRFVDCRWSLDGSQGRAQYLDGHLPGAVFADLDTELAGPPSAAAGRHPLPDPDDFALAMQRLGVHDDTPVLAYDTAGGGIAARLVWMLRILDHPAAVLEFRARDVGSVLEDGEVDVAAGSFSPRPWPPTAIATIDEVAAAAAEATVVIDARDAVRHRGEREPVDARPGRIPGSRNVPWTDNLDRGRLRDHAQVRSRFEDLGADATTIMACGSGVTACHNALAMEAVGMARPRVFVGSYSAWAADPDRPVATGPEDTGADDPDPGDVGRVASGRVDA